MNKARQQLFYFLFLSSSLFLGACSNTKYLPKGETLYLGSKVKILDSVAKNRNDLEETLEEAIRPKPNKKIFGVRFKLTVYNMVGEPKREKGLRKYIRDKIGEPPVTGSMFNLKRNEQILINQLQNNGYFYPEITSQRIEDSAKRTTKGLFEVRTGSQKKFRNIEYMEGDTVQVAEMIRSIQSESLLAKGNPYLLKAITDDRERVDNHLKNNGYYYFSPDFILAKIDTGIDHDSVDVHFRLKYDIMPPKTYQQYSIRDVYINTGYRVFTSATGTRTQRNGDTVQFENYYVIDRNNKFRPRIFKNVIQLKPGELYSRQKQNLTLNRLVSLNAFKFIKNELYDTYDSTGEALLRSVYLLTPYPTQALNAEAAGFTQNDSRVGSRLSLNWKNRNIFRGAEQLNVKLNAGFEYQYGGSKRKLPNLYHGGAEASLTIPRFLFSRWFQVSTSNAFIPRTYVKAGYNFYLREKIYRLNTFNFNLGYEWKEALNKDHKLYPINIMYVKTDTLSRSEDFRIENVIYNGLIFGPSYQFTYNSQIGRRKDLNFYFDGQIDLSGNIVGLIQKTNINEPPRKIFGTPYAQYVKAQTDFRVYKTFGKDMMWANRLFLGVGYAYGNSRKMPNIKQFFSGGASSLRGFRSRMVGPGTFHQDPDSIPNNQYFLELLGDIKFELNTELRAPLYSTWLKGAAFIDAGNIWLLRHDPEFPGGAFSKNWAKEIAVSAGVGLRFDFSILVLRLDFGMPIRKPWMDEGKRWVFNQIDFGNKQWRRENLVFNLAIGYPF